MIAIIDYGMGNLGSVEKALTYLGYRSVITDSPREAMTADGMILPGVGAMGSAMEALTGKGLDKVVREFTESGRPFLGICLGMQMLFDTSEEGGTVKGLGLLPGRVLKFAPDMGLKVPAIGWNDLKTVSHPDLTAGDYVYFVHSYYCRPDRAEDVAATSEYGIEFASAVSRENILATQFHPEKSGEAGLSILNRWARRTK
jgi:imidazole glycerol-phosphate synthase subunit HisH